MLRPRLCTKAVSSLASSLSCTLLLLCGEFYLNSSWSLTAYERLYREVPILLFDRHHPSVPTCTRDMPARAVAVKDGPLRATALAARSVLDGREHAGMIECVGAPIRPPEKPSKASAKAHQITSCCPPGLVTARWIAQMKPHNSRAIAVATIVGRLPFLLSARKRLESRVCAFQAIARTGSGAAATFASLSRPIRGGYR